MTVPRSFQNMGSINIAGVGDVYVVTQDPSTVQMVDNGFRLVGGGRVYFAQEAANDFSNPYTVDVSNVGCHCNSAFYFVQMPGYDAGQNVIAGPGRETERLSMCSFTPVIMWLPTTIPTVMEVAVARTRVMALPDNMDLAEQLTRTSPFLFHTPRFVVEMDSCQPQTHG